MDSSTRNEVLRALHEAVSNATAGEIHVRQIFSSLLAVSDLVKRPQKTEAIPLSSPKLLNLMDKVERSLELVSHVQKELRDTVPVLI